VTSVVPPTPAAAGALRAALEVALADLDSGAPARLPRVPGLDGFVLARWLVRHWLMDAPTWRPHVLLRAAHAGDPAAVAAAAELAAGGWLLAEVAGGVDALALQAEARRWGAGLLRVDDGPVVSAPADFVRRLEWLDPWHAVAVDPAVAEQRRSLLAHCRSAGVVHIHGPPGVGKHELAAWAHAELDDRPACWLRPGGERRPEPGRWAIYEELTELDVDQRFHLRRRLEEAARGTRPPPPPLSGPPERRPDHPAFDGIVGESPALCRVLVQALRAAPSELSVLILGEPGSGKERMAAALHRASGRKGPFWAVDLAAMNEELVESELFGHRRGAFTGADRDRPGAFRQADGGTLFLDELGNLSPRVQGKLLRALQERVIQPVGADQQIRVDVRVVAATNADLESMVSRGEFREDLLRRLDAITLRLPPLREREGDVLLLAERVLAEATQRDRSAPRLSPAAAAILTAYDWPGNIRELGNVVRHASVAAERGVVEPSHLGSLAPDQRRDTPLVTTTSEPELVKAELPGLPRTLLHRLTAVSLRVPSLRERGRLSVRGALLHCFDGHPVSAAVISDLEHRPWWGNLPELAAAVGALKVSGPRMVDAGCVARVLPAVGSGDPPILALLFPSRRADGGVGGLRQGFSEGAVLVGRAASLGELERSLQGQPAGAGRMAELRRLLGGIAPGFLNLSHLPRLSRAHALVSRGVGGLMVHALGGARLPLELERFDVDAAPRSVEPGESAALGRGGVVRVPMGGEDAGRIELYLFEGAVAFEELAERALGRSEPPAQTGIHALPPAPPSPPTPPLADAEAPRPRLWALDPGEVALLNGLVARFRGGDFEHHLEQGLSPRAREPEARRLCAYVLGVRPTQYCGRLYDHPPNRALREDLAARLRLLPEPAALLSLFPLGLRRVVGPLLDDG
jgi:DNA-binding NtrC family response regulator